MVAVSVLALIVAVAAGAVKSEPACAVPSTVPTPTVTSTAVVASAFVIGSKSPTVNTMSPAPSSAQASYTSPGSVHTSTKRRWMTSSSAMAPVAARAVATTVTLSPLRGASSSTCTVSSLSSTPSSKTRTGSSATRPPAGTVTTP